jgi:L-threonylcarbamoyladenylate synthase
VKITRLDGQAPAVREAADLVRRGGVIAYPTDTLYGLGASLRHEQALERIYEIKGRDRSKPILLLVADIAFVLPLVEAVPESARRMMEAFWPGPLTLVFKASQGVPDICLAGGTTVGIRLPDAPVALALLRELQEPLTASSANLSGGPQPVSAQQVAEAIGPRIDLILDGGPSLDARPSTLVDVSSRRPRLLREGRISKESLQPFLR